MQLPHHAPTVRAVATVAALAAFGGEAHAWKHLGTVWSAEDYPITYYVDQACEDSLPREGAPKTRSAAGRKRRPWRFWRWT